MYFQPPYVPPGPSSEIGRWLMQNPNWHLRTETASDDESFVYLYMAPSYRYATADEIAAEIVSSPALRETLGFLASSQGQSIEEAVAGLWLPDWQAALLTDALTLAWKTALDQNRPVWRRAELVGALALIGLFFGLIFYISRD